MRENGRISFLSLAGILGLVLIVGLLFFTKEGPGVTANRFMDALARGDAKTLTELSDLSGRPPEKLEEEWKFATEVAGKYYNFRWRITDAHQADEKSGSAVVFVERNLGGGSSYEEKFELPLNNVSGKWKVDVGAISREMYPGLPRAGS